LQEDWWPDELTGLPEEIHLQEIEEEFKPLAREFLQYIGYDPDSVTGVIDGFVLDLKRRNKTSFEPTMLNLLDQVAKSLSATRI
jgi:hypothetical protein